MTRGGSTMEASGREERIAGWFEAPLLVATLLVATLLVIVVQESNLEAPWGRRGGSGLGDLGRLRHLDGGDAGRHTQPAALVGRPSPRGPHSAAHAAVLAGDAEGREAELAAQVADLHRALREERG